MELSSIDASATGGALATGKGDARLLDELNHCVHELSQPVTVLLCALQYGESVESIVEMREMVKVSQKACGRLRAITVEMREKLRDAMDERGERAGSEGESIAAGAEDS